MHTFSYRGGEREGGGGGKFFLNFLENFIHIMFIVYFSSTAYPIMFIISNMVLSSFPQFSFDFSHMKLCSLEWIAVAVSISS